MLNCHLFFLNLFEPNCAKQEEMSTKRHCPSDYGIVQASGKYFKVPEEITWSLDTLYFYTYAKDKTLNGMCAGIHLYLFKDLNYLGDDEAVSDPESSSTYLMML